MRKKSTTSIKFVLAILIAGSVLAHFYLDSTNIKVKMPQISDGSKPAFKKQNWKKTRHLIWAKPGVSGDYSDPSNWLEDGKPATLLPDKDTDITLPKGESLYKVIVEEDDISSGWITFRHATFEWNASLINMNNTRAYGNIWINKRARFKTFEILNLTGDKHTFVYNDNPESTQMTDGYYALRGMARHIKITKSDDASVELLGRMVFKDEFSVYSGKLICGPNSEILPGGPSTQKVYDGATLELQSGALFSKKMNQYKKVDIVIEGTLQAGSRERPLTSDAFLGLSQAKAASTRISQGETASLIIEDTAKIKVFTKDPEKARLVIKWHGFNPIAKNTPLNAVSAELLGVEILFKSSTMLDNVMFDHVKKEGIRLAKSDDRKQWTNISFGENNHGKPDELFTSTDQK